MGDVLDLSLIRGRKELEKEQQAEEDFSLEVNEEVCKTLVQCLGGAQSGLYTGMVIVLFQDGIEVGRNWCGDLDPAAAMGALWHTGNMIDREYSEQEDD